MESSKGYKCALKREYRALSHIHPVFDRAPRAYAYCEDESVIGAPFIVMERQAGVRSAIPAAFQPLNNIEARVNYALIDAMAEFHALDPVAIGLGEPGKAEGFARLSNRGLCNSIFSGANHQVFNR